MFKYYQKWVGERLNDNAKRYHEFLVETEEPEKYFRGVSARETLDGRMKVIAGSVLSYEADSLINHKEMLHDQESMAVLFSIPVELLDLFPRGAHIDDLTRRDNELLSYLINT